MLSFLTMARADITSKLEQIASEIKGNPKKFLNALAPVINSTQDDLRYLEELVVQNDGRFKRYQGTQELTEYLTHVVQHHKSVLWYTKLADTLDKFGIFFAGEELIEIPLKGALYAVQVSRLLKDNRLKVPYYRLAEMGAKFGLFEMASLVPYAGELADMANVYYNEFMKSIATGVSYNAFIQRTSLGPAYIRV